MRVFYRFPLFYKKRKCIIEFRYAYVNPAKHAPKMNRRSAGSITRLRRKWENEYFCPLCRRSLETPSHLFTECPYSNKVLAAMADHLKMNALQPGNWIGKDTTIHAWFTNLVGNHPKAQRKGIFPQANLICLELWKERNREFSRRKNRRWPD
jgi:hypothetical protein